MRTRLLTLLLLISALPSAWSQTQTYAQIIGSGVKDEGGNLLSSGQICYLPVNQTTGFPMSYSVPGDGVRSTRPVCGAVVNGVITSFPLTNSQITQPANACYNATVTDSSGNVILGSSSLTAKTGFQCVQMNSTWCSVVSGTYTCDWDDYQPSGIAQVTVSTGPTGATGPAGAGYISGLASNGSNGISVTGGATFGSMVNVPSMNVAGLLSKWGRMDCWGNSRGVGYGTNGGTFGYCPQIALRLGLAQQGVVNVSGTAATWVSGANFSNLNAGAQIELVFPGTPDSQSIQTIATVNSSTSLTLSNSVTATNGVTYVAGNNWYNHAQSGSTIFDGIRLMFAHTTSYSADEIDTNEWGANEIGASNSGSNSGAGIPAYAAASLAAHVWLATPQTLPNGTPGKILGSACNGLTGWVASTLADPYVPSLDDNGGAAESFQTSATTNGVPCSFVLSGNVLTIVYTVTGASAGAANLVVDGNVIQTLSTAPATTTLTLTPTSVTRSGTAVTVAYTGTPAAAVGTYFALQGCTDKTFNGTLFEPTSVGSGTVTFTNVLAVSSSTTCTSAGDNYLGYSLVNYGATFAPQAVQVTAISGVPLSNGPHQVTIQPTAVDANDPFYFDFAAGNAGIDQLGNSTLLEMDDPRVEYQYEPDFVSLPWAASDLDTAALEISESYPVVASDTRDAIGAQPGGDIGPYMFAECVFSATFTSGSNVLTSVTPSPTSTSACPSIPAALAAGEVITDSTPGTSGHVPAGTTVASTTSSTITLLEPVTKSVTISTPGSGQTGGIYHINSSGGGEAIYGTVDVYVPSSGAGAGTCTQANWTRYPVGLTGTPTVTMPSSAGGTQCTLTVTFQTNTFTGTETVSGFASGVHDNAYGYQQIANKALHDLSLSRMPNQQMPQSAYVPVYGTTGYFTGNLTTLGSLSVGGSSSLGGPLSITGSSALTSLFRITDSSSATSPNPVQILNSNIAVGGTLYGILGKANSAYNATMIGFAPQTAGGSANYAAFGLYGGAVIDVDGLGDEIVPGSLTAQTGVIASGANTPLSAKSNATSSQGIPGKLYCNSLSTGQLCSLYLGVDGSGDADALESDLYYAGTNNAGNYWGLKLQGQSNYALTGDHSANVVAPISMSSAKFFGTGTATFAAGAAAGTSPGTPACATSHVCDSFSGTISFTTGTSPTTGIILTVTPGATRTNQPNCHLDMWVTSTGVSLAVSPTYTTSTVVFNTAGTAPAASTAYTLSYSGCGGS